MIAYLRAQWDALYQSTAGYITVWLLLYSVALALASSIFFYEIPLPDETTTLSHVSYKVSDVTDPLQLTTDGWHATSLPDNWENRSDKVKNIWYRGSIQLDHQPDHQPNNQWAVFIPALKMNAAVYFNGVFLGDGGRFTDPVARNWMTPLLFSVPNSLLHTGTNTLYIRVKSDPAGSGKLAALQIGDYNGLKHAYNIHYMLRITSIQIITAMLLMMGSLIAMLWLVRRKESYYGYYALAVFVWGLHNFNIFITEIPFSTRTWDWLAYTSIGYYSFLAMIFMHRFLGVKHPVIEITVLTIGTVASLILAMLDNHLFYPAIFLIWYPFVFTIGFYVLAYVGWQAWCRRSIELQFLTATGGTTLILAAHDLLVMHHYLDWQDGYYIQYSAAVLLTLFSFILVRRFVKSLNEVDALNKNLEQRVQQKHQELEINYHQLRRLEDDRIRTDERERLARDIHDGMGGHLVSTLAMIESGQPSLQTISQALRDSLNDLRLMIDSMDIEEDDLESLLGMFRMRIEPRLKNSRIKLDWHVEDTPPINGFGPREALNVLRILQEAVTNTIKHTHAERIQLTCACHHENGTSQVKIEVTDNGSGFSQNKPQDHESGNGLDNMQQRASRVGGKLSIHSDTHGTRITLILPSR